MTELKERPMARIECAQPVRAVQIDAVLVRADGTRVPLGTIAYWHRNPLRRLLHACRRRFTR